MKRLIFIFFLLITTSSFANRSQKSIEDMFAGYMCLEFSPDSIPLEDPYGGYKPPKHPTGETEDTPPTPDSEVPEEFASVQIDGSVYYVRLSDWRDLAIELENEDYCPLIKVYNIYGASGFDYLGSMNVCNMIYTGNIIYVPTSLCGH